jgi:glycosyltransferase involved in cell wall biosynthesis
METANTLVTIIVATMHRPHFLIDSLKSIQNQNIINWECIVVLEYDHGPTRMVMEEMVQTDQRFQFHIKPKEAGAGVSNSRNFGLTKASGNFIQFFDDDDMMLPFHLRMKLELFEMHPLADFVVCKLGGFNGAYNGTSNDPPSYGFEGWLGKEQITDFFSKDYKINSCAGMMRRRIFDKVKWNAEISCEDDLVFYVSTLMNGFIGYETSRVGYHYRQHPDSMTGDFFAGEATMRASQVLARQVLVSLLASHHCLNAAIVRSNLILAMKLHRMDLKRFIIAHAKDALPQYQWTIFKELNFVLVGWLYRKTRKGLRFVNF